MKRPILRYFGGKYVLAPWIVSHLPEHRVYVEPYGGAGSVLMRKPKSYAEVWNDLDDGVFNLFSILRCKSRAAELQESLRLTPFSRREFELAHVRHPDPIESARRLIVRSFMGFGADSVNNINSKTSFRSDSNRSGTTPAHDWANYAPVVQAFADRLSGVVIENRDAFEVMAQHDGPDTLHYVDPPYPLKTRGGRHRYNHEMTDQQHVKLGEFLLSLKGRVVLSGYETDLYDLPGWVRAEKVAFADGAKKRKEILWIK